jgi:hypothetical protein
MSDTLNRQSFTDQSVDFDQNTALFRTSDNAAKEKRPLNPPHKPKLLDSQCSDKLRSEYKQWDSLNFCVFLKTRNLISGWRQQFVQACSEAYLWTSLLIDEANRTADMKIWSQSFDGQQASHLTWNAWLSQCMLTYGTGKLSCFNCF